MKQKSLNIVAIIIGVSALIFIFLGLILYFNNVNSTLSTNSKVLADFATFNSYFLSIASTLLLGGISFFGYIATSRYNKAADEYNKLLIKPVLYANNITKTNRSSALEYTYPVWVLGNASKHPAINMLVRHTITKPNEHGPLQIGSTRWVSCSSLAGDQSIELFWIYYAYNIEICYTDATEENYYLSTIANLRVKTESISKEFYDIRIGEADKNRDNNIINLMEKCSCDKLPSHNIEMYVGYIKSLQLLLTEYEPDLSSKSKIFPQIFPQTTAPPPSLKE